MKSKSTLLFTLLFCSFFSCQQLLDVIKPQPPKPVEETCRLLQETLGSNGTPVTYEYDNMGRVVKIVLNPDPVTGVYDVLTYNAANQITKQSRSQFRRGDFERVFQYDSQGRVIKDVAEVSSIVPTTVTNEYTYTSNTIRVKTTSTSPLEEPKTWDYTYVFENENLVKIIVDSDVVVNTFEYSTTLNKLSPLEKQLAYVKGITPDGRTQFSPSMSKNLVSREENPLSGLVTGYTWELNEKGYPTKQASVNRFGYFEKLYEYNCGNH